MSEADRARWNAKYQAGTHGDPTVTPTLRAVAASLPAQGRAIDLAGGRGANAVWLAGRGLAVTLVDISDVALAAARSLAEARGVPLSTLQLDLEREPIPAGPWDLVLCSSYLERAMWGQVPLAPGGRLVWIHPTVTNLERNPKPSQRFLLKPGEGASIIAALPNVRIHEHREDWIDGRHLSVVIAERTLAGR
ncbi:MAG: class I SAM-dependent methyltransferase [Myxococcota bacterium]